MYVVSTCHIVDALSYAYAQKTCLRQGETEQKLKSADSYNTYNTSLITCCFPSPFLTLCSLMVFSPQYWCSCGPVHSSSGPPGLHCHRLCALLPVHQLKTPHKVGPRIKLTDYK